MKLKIILISFFWMLQASAQDTINQLDQNGERHGPWKKMFKEAPSQPRYEGTFEHGKETGLFKFYQLGQKNPAATKLFSPDSDTVEVKFFSQKGKLISEGKMIDTTRIGEWKYYHKNSDKLMMTENYEKGVLHGEKITYFDNGNIAKKSLYRSGKLNGEMFMYSEKGVVLEHLNYQNGQLHGPAKFYNGKGELVTEGNYRNNRHHGLWKYYENGKLKEEKIFSDQNIP